VVCLQRQETQKKAPISRNIELQLGEVNPSDEARLELDLFTSEYLGEYVFCASSNVVGDHAHVGRSGFRSDD
jgi:hypothetical protein